MENYNQQGYYQTPDVAFAANVSKAMRSVYLKMFLALLVTAATSFVVLAQQSFLIYMLNNQWVYWGLLIAELVLVFSVSARLNKISTTTANLMFYAYSILNGIVLSVIFKIYTSGSIAQTFLITAGVFRCNECVRILH